MPSLLGKNGQDTQHKAINVIQHNFKEINFNHRTKKRTIKSANMIIHNVAKKVATAHLNRGKMLIFFFLVVNAFLFNGFAAASNTVQVSFPYKYGSFG